MRTHSHAHGQTRKLRFWLILTGLSLGIVLIWGYAVAPFGTDTPIASGETQQETILPKNIQLAWPEVGYAAIGSVEDGVLAHSSDNEEPRPTASMAKVITALAIMEKQPFDLGEMGESYRLTSEDVGNYHREAARDGSVLPVYDGMVLTQYQAMQAMLIASSNNIADLLADRIFGSEEAYRSYAQKMLKRMGLRETVVADASGFNPATASTPSDLVMIGIAALKNPVIADIVAQPHAWIQGVGIVKNTNELLTNGEVVGIKTGTTNEAGSCLLFAARYTNKNNQEVTIVGVIMGNTNSAKLFRDSETLLASTKQALGLTEDQRLKLNNVGYDTDVDEVPITL